MLIGKYTYEIWNGYDFKHMYDQLGSNIHDQVKQSQDIDISLKMTSILQIISHAHVDVLYHKYSNQ